MTIQSKLTALRELANSATSGKWYVAEVAGYPYVEPRQFVRSRESSEEENIDHAICEAFGGTGPRPLDAAFIASSRTTIPLLLSALEAACEGLEEAQEALLMQHSWIAASYEVKCIPTEDEVMQSYNQQKEAKKVLAKIEKILGEAK